MPGFEYLCCCDSGVNWHDDDRAGLAADLWSGSPVVDGVLDPQLIATQKSLAVSSSPDCNHRNDLHRWRTDGEMGRATFGCPCTVGPGNGLWYEFRIHARI